MATWRQAASDHRSATYELFVGNRWRSCASRAYYAVYSEVTHGVLAAGVTMPAGQGNPRHGSLPTLIGMSLAPLSLASRWRLSGLVGQLYGLRIIADYLPGVILEQAEARITIGLMEQAFAILKVVP